MATLTTKLSLSKPDIDEERDWGERWNENADILDDAVVSTGNLLVVNESTDRVGIGTASPQEMLHVTGSGVVVGRLGVGTSSPTSQLDVTIATGPQIKAGDWSDMGSNGAGQGFLGGNFYTDKSGNAIRYAATHASIGAMGLALNYPAWNKAAIITSATTASTADQQFTPTTIMTWDYTGDVGIGTDSPTEALHVIGSGIVEGHLTVTEPNDADAIFDVISGDGDVSIRMKAGSSTAQNADLEFIDRGTNAWIIRKNSGNNLSFISVPSPASTPFLIELGAPDNQMRLKATGNVGFGTASATERLHVVGSGIVEGKLTVNTTVDAFYPPRMTTTQRDALSPAVGALVYNTTTDKLNVYTGSWEAITSA